jgi:hypothetical protein
MALILSMLFPHFHCADASKFAWPKRRPDAPYKIALELQMNPE